MTVAQNGRKRKRLAIPDISGMSCKEAAHAYLRAGFTPVPWIVRRRTKILHPAVMRGAFLNEWHTTHSAIDAWPDNAQVGLLCSRSGGIIAVDIDKPEEFEAWEIDADFMDDRTAVSYSGRGGGARHLLYDARDLAQWPTQGRIPGADVKSNGFIAVAPSVHPSGRKYRWAQAPTELVPIGRLGNVLRRVRSEHAAAKAKAYGDSDYEALRAAVLDAGDGEQHDALRALVYYLQTQIADPNLIVHYVLSLPIKQYGRRPYNERDIRQMLKRNVIADASDEEMAGVQEMRPIAEDSDESEFWESSDILSHIRELAYARLASPWAVFGECLAEAICHTLPALQLPPIVGGEGTLNMLIAIVGKSGAGKNAAAQAARSAFRWTGITGEIDDDVERIPLGSGEGLARTFGYTYKDSGVTELVRSRTSAIITVPEIDTFAAINARSGATISPELRKLYSGEALGFSWSDPNKRIIIPAHDYRACVIAGVQPGRGEIILGDVDGGFAQRWLWLPAEDPAMPDERPEMPSAKEWKPAGLAAEYEPRKPMPVVQSAWDAITQAQLDTHRGEGDEMETHALYTRLKVAAGLALLEGCDEVEQTDWDRAGFVMLVSARTRKIVEDHLRRKAHEANLAAGRAEGVRKDAAALAESQRVTSRIARNVLSKLSTDVFTGQNALAKRIAARDRESLAEVLRELVDTGRVEERGYTHPNGEIGIRYRRISQRS